MGNNVVLVNFKVKSEAYEVFTKLSNKNITDDYTIKQMYLVVKEEKGIDIEDTYDSGIDTSDDTLIGGIIGGIIGIFSGPIGFLLFGSLGALIGSSVDVSDASENMNILKEVSDILDNNEIAIIALVQEKDEVALEDSLKNYNADIVRFDAAEIQYELDQAEELQELLEKETKKMKRDSYIFICFCDTKKRRT